MKFFLGLFTLLLCMQSAIADVYTCTYKGQTVYQGKPCPNSVKTKLNVPQQALAYLTDTQKYKLWKAARDPQIGMTGDQIIKATYWGAPNRKSAYTTSRGKDELWYYTDLGYITFKNGKVTSISENSGSD